MTLMLRTDTPVPVSAWKYDKDRLQLTVSTSFAFLSREEAAELATYLTTFAFGEGS